MEGKARRPDVADHASAGSQLDALGGHCISDQQAKDQDIAS